MSIQSSSLVIFPKRAEILSFYNNHSLVPDSLNTALVQRIVPDNIAKVANFFADQKMSLNEIRKNIEVALKQEGAFKDLYELKNSPPEGNKSELQELNEKIEQAISLRKNLFHVVVDVHVKVLHQLLENNSQRRTQSEI